MTLRDSAVSASLRCLVIHRFIRHREFFPKPPAANCGHFLFALELGEAKSRE
jgi:hypothetical protein